MFRSNVLATPPVKIAPCHAPNYVFLLHRLHSNVNKHKENNAAAMHMWGLNSLLTFNTLPSYCSELLTPYKWYLGYMHEYPFFTASCSCYTFLVVFLVIYMRKDSFWDDFCSVLGPWTNSKNPPLSWRFQESWNLCINQVIDPLHDFLCLNIMHVESWNCSTMWFWSKLVSVAHCRTSAHDDNDRAQVRYFYLGDSNGKLWA